MKYTYLALILFVLLFSSCDSQITEKHFIGTWKVIDFKAQLKDLSTIIIEDAKNVALSSTYVFYKNNICKYTCTHLSLDMEGTYQYDVEANQIIMKFNQETSKESYEVVLIKQNIMKWELDNKEMGFLTMTLQKKNKAISGP
ncbi:MAG: hypothetical protein LRY27_00960 [Chitinophagales bacterium]|nr:hypothetical protein [Chitinophagales bacterium]